MKKILIYGANFAPELTGIGKYSGEMAGWLSLHGFEVRVIAAAPYYPDWKVFSGYSSGRYRREYLDGVTVFRSPMWVPAKPTGLKRILHLFSFSLSTIPLLILQSRWRPDIVWITEPPLMCSPAALFFSKIWGSKSWLHIQDYEVDAAFDLGVLKGARIRRFVLSVERFVMRKFDTVSTISSKMMELALRKGVESSRLVLFPNWVDISSIKPLTQPSRYRELLGINKESLVALYSGNMGGKQGLEILGEVATLLKDDPRFFFVFCGKGAGRAALELQCASLRNVIFLDLQPMDQLSELLGLADIHLLPQRGDAADLVMPSKLTGMLASGRPVVATAHSDTELASVVDKCGIVVPPGDAVLLKDALVELACCADRRGEMGRYARSYAESELDKNAILNRFKVGLA